MTVVGASTGGRVWWARLAAAVVATMVLGSCAADGPAATRAGPPSGAVASEPDPSSTAVTPISPTTTSAPTSVPSTPSPTPVPTVVLPVPVETTVTVAPRPHVVSPTGFAVYATIGSLALHHPAARIEAIGFHQASHDGAQPQTPTADAVRPMVLAGRGRGTDARSAADIVVPPDETIRSPVTGTVIRAGEYTLYCDDIDEYVVIEPDGLPGWEVKVLHVVGVRVAAGQRVDAAVTPIAAHSHQLPFVSQVDAFTGEPAWGHVHIEVVDTSIPDRPGGGGNC